MNKTSYDVAIVGAGPNGLTAAVVLSLAGLSVVVLEGNPTIGGSCTHRAADPARFSTRRVRRHPSDGRRVADLPGPAAGSRRPRVDRRADGAGPSLRRWPGGDAVAAVVDDRSRRSAATASPGSACCGRSSTGTRTSSPTSCGRCGCPRHPLVDGQVRPARSALVRAAGARVRRSAGAGAVCRQRRALLSAARRTGLGVVRPGAGGGGTCGRLACAPAAARSRSSRRWPPARDRMAA